MNRKLIWQVIMRINRIIMEFKLKIINKQKQVGAELIES